MTGRRRVLTGVLVVVGVLITGMGVTLGIIFFGGNDLGGKETRDFYVSRGETFSAIADSLTAAGIVNKRETFVFVAKVLGRTSRIKVGKYTFHRGVSNRQILHMLVSGRDGELIRVTLREGWTARQQARLLARTIGIDSLRYLALVADPDLARTFGIEAPTLEGYLFPDTYAFAWNQEEMDILRAMTGEYKRFFGDSLKQRAAELGGWTENQVITLASIVEGESRLPEERPVISGIYHNRLRKRMYLQADPTIQYALENGPRRLYYDDLKLESPYNTYRHLGLPPGPVNNPGQSAILAALYPQQNHFLYFVANGKGGHLFARTYDEHLRNVRLYRRNRASARRRAEKMTAAF